MNEADPNLPPVASQRHAPLSPDSFRPDGPQRPRTVLALGGGAMRGMAHIGVIRAIQQLGLPIDAIVGTSIGSLVGALAATGCSTERMLELVGTVQKGDFFQLNFVKFLLKGMRVSSMYRGDTFRARLEDILPDMTFADMPIPFYCNAVCLETGGLTFWGAPGLEDISLVDAVYSSCALPGIFEPLQRDGRHYMDGGMVDALPLRFAKSLRPDVVLAVDLTVKGTQKHPNYKDKVIGTLYRAFEIAEEVITEQGLHMHADDRTVLIQPKVSSMDRFDFSQLEKVVTHGEETAIRVLTSHAATRYLVDEEATMGMACPVQSRDYVSIRIDAESCIGCGNCAWICETDAYIARAGLADVRKVANYECTRDHACARNCPTQAIHLGNL